jgi:hypothetical protein
MKRRGGAPTDTGDLQLFLFDHALLMVKQKSKHEQYKVYRRASIQLLPEYFNIDSFIVLLAYSARAADSFRTRRTKWRD